MSLFPASMISSLTPAFTLNWPWLSLTSSLHILSFLAVTYHCLRERREASSALLWIFVAWSFPVIGPLSYLCFGVNRVPAKSWLKQRADQQLRGRRQQIVANDSPQLSYWRAVHDNSVTEPDTEFARELNSAINAALTDYPLLGGNNIELLITGDEAFPAMLEAIDKAQDHIHLQCFIIHNDSVGQRFMEALARKAADGVKVRMLYDRFGSTHGVLTGFFRKYRNIPNLETVGWTQANPIKRQFQLNLRNHRKVLIVDGREAFTGGINISKKNITRQKSSPIQDYHFKVSGPIVQEMQFSFMGDWHFMTSQDAVMLLDQRYFPPVETSGSALIRLVNGGPSTSESNIISDVYFTCIVSAERDIVAATPYLVPTIDLLQAFRAAALRGVRVRIVLPEKNNHAYAGMASRARYDTLLEAGVEIYERQPPFMHAKSLVVDDSFAFVGTANLDERSLRLNYETNLAIYDEKLAGEVKRALLAEIEVSKRIQLAEWRQRAFAQRIAENFCNLLTPIL
ncbi:MAG: cardiolipin synthase [Lentisphaeria bacterium]